VSEVSDYSASPPSVSPRLARSLARTRARTRLERDLRGIAIDLLGRCEPDDLSTDCAGWLATAVEVAVASVCDASLASLAEALDSSLASVPPTVAMRLDEAEARHDAGYT
jgi:hypothetical protein